MQTITYKQIMSFGPCYDPKEIEMPEDYNASLKDFIIEYRNKVKSLSDILWVVLRKDFFNERDLRLFSVWSALQVKHLMKDERSLNALIVAEKYAFDEETVFNMTAACAAAARAAEAAATAWATAAAGAAWAAGDAEAAEAACAAAARAAWAAEAAAWAAEAAAWAAGPTEAAGAAEDATRDAQIDMVLKMIEKPNGEWFQREAFKKESEE